MKTCPFCAESIQDEAVKCRYCGEFLDGRQPAAPVTAPTASVKKPWYQKEFAIWGGFCCVGPFILPLVWTNSEYSLTRKIIYTGIMLAVTLMVVKLLMFAIESISAAYQMLPTY